MSPTRPKTQDRKFHLDVLWNVASLAILGVSGVVLNVVIARTVGAEALGVFNQVFAVYIFLSQLSVGAVHLSVLTFVARHPRDSETCASITVSALALGAGLASLWAVITWMISTPVGRIFDSSGVAEGLVLVAPGLLFFALNKILLNALNGAAAMRAYAIFQAARFLLILGAVLAILWLEVPGAPLAASLTIAEGVLLPCLLLQVHFGLWRLRPSLLRRRWLRKHFSFGARGLLSGALSEINTRVDILMLGFFTSDGVVGIYSVAAILAEGFGQLSIVLRRNVDPLPAAMPYLVFDEEGVRNYCHGYQRNELRLRQELEDLLLPLRREGGESTCLLGLSGGRDSSYALHLLTRELGMKPVTFTYDWGMVTDLARRNISRMVGELGVEHILVSADIKRKRLNIRKNVSAWLEKPDLGIIPLFMAGDKQYFYHANRLKKQLGVEKTFLGENLLERTDFKTGYCGIPPAREDDDRVYVLGAGSQLRMLAYYGRQYLGHRPYLNASLLDTPSPTLRTT